MDPLESARQQGYADLPVSQSAWVFCVSRMVDLDPTYRPTLEVLAATSELATSRGFPNGPMAYYEQVDETIVRGKYVARELRFKRDGTTLSTVFLGIGDAGFASVTATRHDNVDDVIRDTPLPAHVLQSDVEGYLIDALMWAHVYAKVIGYEGLIEVEVSISDEVPGHPLTLCRVDPEAGSVDLDNAYRAPFPPMRVSSWTHEDSVTVHARIAETAQEIGRAFGSYGSQYIDPPDPERPSDFYPEL
ncbi:MAG: hypothetical protein Q4G51_02985 [Dermatophilus congolensis]|nr:hypothetical protein [Dermatophilus congolensis]